MSHTADRFQHALEMLRTWAASEMGEQELLDSAVQSVSTALGVDLCKILKLESSGATLLVVSGIGWEPGVVGHERVRAGSSTQDGMTMAASTPIEFPRLAGVGRIDVRSLLRRHGVVSSLSATVGASEDPPFGVLSVHARSPRVFGDDDGRFLVAAASVLAEGIDRRQVENARRAMGPHGATRRRAPDRTAARESH